jgi:hypothetical protein
MSRRSCPGKSKGTGDEKGQLAAESVTFNSDDFKTAEAMHARVASREARTSQNEEDIKAADAPAKQAQALPGQDGACRTEYLQQQSVHPSCRQSPVKDVESFPTVAAAERF